MADTFKGIITADGKKRQLPYRNVIETPVSDETLSIQGAFADSKAVGDKFKEAKTETDSLKTETGSLKEDLSTKITKFYASSQGETHLADSDNGKIMDMMLYGKSEQKQYSGDNIYYMDYEDYSQTYNGVRITSTKFGYSVSGTFSDTGAYTLINRYITLAPGTYKMLLKNISALKIGLSKRDYSAITTISEGKTDTTFTLDEETEVCLTIRYSNTTSNETNEIMLTKNLEATSYEPYTGGIPSPNPDYPQEIKSVVNPTVKIVGKNLLNPTLQTTTRNGVTCTANGDGTYTLNGTATSNTQLVVGYHNILDGQVKMLGCPSGGSTKTYCVIMQFSSGITGGEKGRIYDIGNGGVGSTSDSIKSGANYIRGIISIMSGTTCNNLLFRPMLTTDLTATYDDFEPYKEQTVTLPYTLNAIPVSSGGNVTIDGQQYVADYVDVEREKLVRMVDSSKLDNTQSIVDKTEWLLAEPQEIDLTQEEVQALKALSTYYPTTNISVNSEQLDGYTVFNYPISIKNGWNYVKQQIGDTRDYIYDIDARTQDTDLQAAEAYVNSEYAVALTELEV